jgi:hypothetical protein
LGEIAGRQAGNQPGHSEQAHRQSDLSSADVEFLVGEQGKHGGYGPHANTGNEDGQTEENDAPMLSDGPFDLPEIRRKIQD